MTDAAPPGPFADLFTGPHPGDHDRLAAAAASTIGAVARATGSGPRSSLSPDELAALVADLPADGTPRVEIVGQSVVPNGPLSSVFGDIKLSATTGVPQKAGTVFGDVRIDLRGLRTAEDTVYLQLASFFGDVEVIVSEGVAAQMEGWTFFGSRKTDLAAVPRLPGTPRVVVRGWSFFGELRLRSLAPGESPSRWRAAMDRLAQRRLAPPA